MPSLITIASYVVVMSIFLVLTFIAIEFMKLQISNVTVIDS